MEDKELKELLKGSKLEASENLKDRIIHQINAEQVLIPKKKKAKVSSGNYFYILGIMYFILLVLAGYFYQQTNANPFESNTYIAYTLIIGSSFSLYWFINVYVDYRKNKV